MYSKAGANDKHCRQSTIYMFAYLLYSFLFIWRSDSPEQARHVNRQLQYFLSKLNSPRFVRPSSKLEQGEFNSSSSSDLLRLVVVWDDGGASGTRDDD
jgi:hypothetical protein